MSACAGAILVRFLTLSRLGCRPDRKTPPPWASQELAAHGVEADHVKIRQTDGKRRRRHGLLMSGEPREPGYRVEGLRWEAKRVRSTERAVETAQPH